MGKFSKFEKETVPTLKNDTMDMETRSTFEDLNVWKMSRKLRLEFRNLVSSFPKEEKFRLCDQISRAARSVTNNIAEGYGRFHFQENIQYCRQARGSLYELIDHLIICLEEGYIATERMNNLKSKIFITIRTLNGYIAYLKKQKQLN